MAQLQIPTLDYAGQASTITMNVDDAISDANITVLFDATMALSKAEAGQSNLVTSVPKDAGAGTNSTDPDAARELKYFVSFTDPTTGKKGSFEIPAAEGSALSAGQETVNLSSGVGATFKTAAESHVKSRDGNAIVINEVRRVGRDL